MERSYKTIGVILRWIAKNHNGKDKIDTFLYPPPAARDGDFRPMDSGSYPSKIEGLTNDEAGCYIKMMVEGGLIGLNDEPDKAYPNRITWAGYEFLHELSRWAS